LVLAIVAHVAVRIAFFLEPRYLACEDDGYRLYLSFLFASGQSPLIGRFWLPGQLLLVAPLLRAGVDPALAGVLVSTLALVGLAVAMRGLVRSLAPAGAAGAAGAVAAALVLASPLSATLAQSALAELPFAALATAAAWGFAAGSRRGLAGGAVALLAATWVRYEAWPLAGLYAVAGLWRRRPLALLPLLGPALWLLGQAREHGDPLTFLHQTAAVTNAVGALAVAGHRLLALVQWAPAALALALLGGRPARPALAFLVWMAAGVLLPAASGGEHPVFPDRMAHGLEVGLVPLAALGLARLHARLRPVLAVAAVASVAIAALRPPVFLDAEAVAQGLRLRADDGVLRGGTLLVERPEVRPPLGWASLGALWGRWDRIVWATPHGGSWQLVRPLDVAARAEVPDAELPSWLRGHGVTGAWIGGRLRLLPDPSAAP
jgi:hypothetical protein